MSFIEVRDLAKSFASPTGPRRVLRGVSLDVDHGEFVSIVGAMGSGKSTLLSLIAGLTMPDAGSVSVGGEPTRGVRRDAAFVFQNYSLLPWFTALENVRLAVEATFPDMSREEQRRHATRALEQVGLGNAIDRRPKQLSGGMRQRVAIARAFATKPQVLFLDEPFGALDALTRETLQQELSRLCSEGERPVTTVMITNSVEEAILLSDRIVPIIPGPPATLGTPIPVELSRPRSLAQLAHDEQATQVRAHVVSTLTASVRGRTLSGTAPSTAPAASLGAGASAKAALAKSADPFDSRSSLRAGEIR
jgi:nitrate/nitrite transport system ATP-binding protein